LHPIDFAAVARACGVAGYALSDPAQCAVVLREALATAGFAALSVCTERAERLLDVRGTHRTAGRSTCS
jgi:pyruvate dehydrogenase (quinone)